MLRRCAPAAVLLATTALIFSCGGGSGRRGQALPEALRGLPPHQDPPVDLTDDDDLGRARAAFDALPLDDGGRAAARAGLWAEYQRRVQLGLGHDDRERAFATFQQAISMWHPSELANLDTPAPGLDIAGELSETIYQRFSATGNDVEAATALAVLRAAHPERSQQLDDAWREIAEYVDSLAVASARSQLAAGFRPIEILESVTEWFPSRWAGEKLIDLYLARQQAVQGAIQGGTDTNLLSFDPMTRFPVFVILRVYARMGRIDDGLATVDGLAGQHGDWPELRDALRDALDPKSKAGAWAALAPIFVSEDLPQSVSDWRAAYRVCETGMKRFPQAPEPREMAARIATSFGRNPALAIRLAEEALALGGTAEQRLELVELLSRLYIVRLNDLVTAERLDAGRARLGELEAFHAKVAQEPRPKAKPKDPKDKSKAPKDTLNDLMADAYQVMGFGLFAAGEITDAEKFVAKAQKLKVSPAGLERLATIADKRGQHQEAAKLYQQAAALHLAPDSPDSPMEQAMEEARLRRLAGDAYLHAGDKGRAETLWLRALAAWPEILGAMNERRDAAIAYVEIGRLRYLLGERKEALQSFERAVDADPEAAASYADVIAFLTTRGEYEAAHDAWLRALGRPEVTEYYKVYTSLWVIGLARIRGEKVDDAGVEFLGSRSGQRWFHDLARFGAGKITYEQLLDKADTRGKRAEAMYYQALNLYAAGDRAGAEALLQGVISTEMFGFFEFDMAKYFLDHGPPR